MKTESLWKAIAKVDKSSLRFMSPPESGKTLLAKYTFQSQQFT